MKNIVIIMFIVAPLLAVLPQAVRYLDAQQANAEKVYYNLGVATVRLMDPMARKGVAIEGAWNLSDSKK